MSTSRQMHQQQQSKRGRKPLTRLQHWQKQVNTIKALISELDIHHQGQGAAWIAGMRTHYDKRLKLLMDNRPKATKK